jgi:hypothetical protein
VTVTSVRVNSEVTMLSVTAKNSGGETIALPIYTSAQLERRRLGHHAGRPGGEQVGHPGAAGREAQRQIVFDGVSARTRRPQR